MRYRYYICDGFTDSRFSGNQLAVLPEADGLGDEQMQQIAREFNFSESTFVLPPDDLWDLLPCRHIPACAKGDS
jgi:trans-2,3-dihydro-3-hydroxyanthranilate isomerase